ncbi:MAG TPA: hypothetical protein VJ124_17730 [Pyrinomonadaceae bacterium]|nr:hypothetical protein [Pyrinomonadaceae bacterium]
MKKEPSAINSKEERGAALVSVLLISTLLLTAGGMLILTTSMTGTNTFDSVAEQQAYYAAEAGIQASLNVLRGNVMPNPLFVTNPPGTIAPGNKIDFRKAITYSTSNLASDPTTGGFPKRLSRWLTYNYTPTGSTYADRLTMSQSYTPFNGTAFSLAITDPDNTAAPAQPLRLIVDSTGYGPRGARKTLSMMVYGNRLEIETPATLVLRGHDDHLTNLFVDLGSSAAKTYSGVDNSGTQPTKPAFAISAHDASTIEAAYSFKPGSVSNPKYKVLDLPNEPAPPGLGVPVPWFLKTANDARSFVAQAQMLAAKYGVILSSLNGSAGSPSAPQFTYVNGDCHLDSGAGLLIVRGSIYFDGAGPNFNGTILVLGAGRVVKQGGGNRNLYGSMTVARFGATGDFLEPIFDYSAGVGTSNLQFDSVTIRNSVVLAGPKVLGMIEK